jgi:hypothetical protein
MRFDGLRGLFLNRCVLPGQKMYSDATVHVKLLKCWGVLAREYTRIAMHGIWECGF